MLEEVGSDVVAMGVRLGTSVELNTGSVDGLTVRIGVTTGEAEEGRRSTGDTEGLPTNNGNKVG